MSTNRYSHKQFPISRPQERVIEQPDWQFPAKSIECSLLKAQQPLWVFPAGSNIQDLKQEISISGSA
jgi:hypothetical protein